MQPRAADQPILALPRPERTFRFVLWWNSTAVGEHLNFPQDSSIQGRELVRIRVGNSLNDAGGSPSTPNVNTTLPLNLLRGVFLTIVDVDGRYCLNNCPAALLSYPRSIFVRERMFKGIRIDMERSFCWTNAPLVPLKNLTLPIELLFQ